jgi:hypothetical protein
MPAGHFEPGPVWQFITKPMTRLWKAVRLEAKISLAVGNIMASKRILRVLLSSLWLRTGAVTLIPLVFMESVLYVGGAQFSLRLESRLLLLIVVAAALELWLRTDTAKAITAPLAARIGKSRIWRKFNKLNPGPIANSVTLTVIVFMLMCAGMMAAVIAVMACLDAGFSHRVIDAVLDAWRLYAGIAGFGTLWLIFYHAGIDPGRAIDRIFLWGGIGFVGFVAGLIWAAYTHSTEFNSLHNHETQRAFRNAILSAPVPCVAVQDKLSDLSACTVFGLRPGMTQGETLRGVNGSGYFRDIVKPSACKTSDKCIHYVTFIKDGLYVRVEFKTNPKSVDAAEQVSSIVLCLDEGANPYFDENEIMATFIKRIGPNGFSIDNFTVWRDIKSDLELQAYTYDSKFWAIFSRLGERPNLPGSGVRV